MWMASGNLRCLVLPEHPGHEVVNRTFVYGFRKNLYPGGCSPKRGKLREFFDPVLSTVPYLRAAKKTIPQIRPL